jgi:ubiquinone/menaquinone biosynthesis C-methylase UbiE
MDQAVPLPGAEWPGPADIAYQTQAQAGGFGQTLRSFVKFLDLSSEAVVLDVGTGPGLVVRLLAARTRLVVGSDRSPEMLAHARSLLSDGAVFAGAWAAADALQLPFSCAAFDAAMATNLMFLLPEPARAISELTRVVRSGGVVGWLNPSAQLSQASAAAFADERGLTGFARFSLVNYGRIAEQHDRLSGQQWTEMAEGAGLEDIVVEGRGGGLMTLLKGRKRRDG